MSQPPPELKNGEDVDQVAAMLDEALKGFSPKPAAEATTAPAVQPTSDEELEAIMTMADQEAAQKAAGEFQKMLTEMVRAQEAAMAAQAENKTDQRVGMDADDPEAQAMMESLRNLLTCTETVANAESSADFLAGLDMLRSPGNSMEPFMSMIMQTLASKEVMYPPMKEIFDKYPAYLEEHGPQLDAETKERYEKQLEVLGRICEKFESEPSRPAPAPQDAATEAAGPDAAAPEPSELELTHFEQLGFLLVELQKYGYPPSELIGELPDGWKIDETGLPRVEDPAAASEACSIM